MLSAEARQATDKAIWLQVRDVAKAAFDEAQFTEHCKKLSTLKDDPIKGDPIKLIDNVAKKFSLSEMVAGNMRKHLIEGADLTRCGLFNCVTRSAEDCASYDEASELERLGGRIVELAPNEWRELDKAAA